MSAPRLYPVLRFLGRLTLRVFLRRIWVRREAPIPEEGPILFASNHPNGLLDPLSVAYVSPRPVHFLAKSGLFSFPPVAWFLKGCGVLPVYRRMDNNPGDMSKNQGTFDACHRVLADGGAIGIFPEGTSHYDPQVRKLKTGAARIAFEAEEKNDFRLGIRLVPLGLTFPDRFRIRTELGIHVGEPIPLAPFLGRYRQDPQATVQEVTGLLHDQLKSKTIHLDQPELARLVRDVESVYRHDLMKNLERADPFAVQRGIAQAVEHFHRQDPEALRRIEVRVTEYLGRLGQFRIRDEALRSLKSRSTWPAWLARTAAISIVGLPIGLYGIVNNYVPYQISRKLGGKLAEGPLAQERIWVGLPAFMIFYALQTWLCWSAFGAAVAAAYAITLPAAGFFALSFWRRARAAWRRIRTGFLELRRPALVRSLRSERASLISEFDRLRDRYWQAVQTG